MSTAWIAAFLLQWAVIVVIAIMLIGVLRRSADALELAEERVSPPTSLGGIPVASQAPHFDVLVPTDALANGAHVQDASELLDSPTILLFMKQHCPPCRALAKQLGSNLGTLDDMHLRIVLAEEDGLPDWLPVGLPVIFERDKSVTRALQNSASPQAYVLDTDRLVLAKRIVRSIDDLWELQSTAHHMGGDALAIHISDRI